VESVFSVSGGRLAYSIRILLFALISEPTQKRSPLATFPRCVFTLDFIYPLFRYEKMRKPLPLKKIFNKLDHLYDLQEALEREDPSQDALWFLDDRILFLEYFLEEQKC
jgi:hypothetical protein